MKIKLIFFVVFVLVVYGIHNYVAIPIANQQTELALKQFDKSNHVDTMSSMWAWSFDSVILSLMVLFVGLGLFWANIHSCIGWFFKRSDHCCKGEKS